jgi:hypothetical protein
MPRTKSKPALITIGVFGLGEAAPKTIAALLEDYCGDGEVKFIVPATADHYSGSIAAVVEYLEDENISYDVVTDSTTAKARSLRNVVKNADTEHKASDVGAAIVNLLKDAEDGRLLVFWDGELGDEEDGGAYDAVEYADEHDIPAFDLCDGLAPIDLDADDEDDQDEPEPEKAAPKGRAKPADDDPDDEPAPAARRRGRAAAEPEEDDADEPAGTTRGKADKSLPEYEAALKEGVRALRTLARDLELAPHRKIGSMDKPTVLDLLYPLDGAAPAAAPDDDEEPEEAPAPRRRSTRAKQAELPFEDGSGDGLQAEVAAAGRKATAAHVALPVELNGDAAVVLGQFIHLLAKEVATLVVVALEDQAK